MLNFLRKAKSSWFIKALMGAIILSFIFFFGYSRISKSFGKGVVASVNGEPIYHSEYKLVLENNFGIYKDLYKDQELPEYLVESIRQGSLRQLIHNKLINQLGEKIGIIVTNDELRDYIMKTPYFQKDGVFNADYYKNNFLPHFRDKYNLDYEELTKEELLLTATRDLFQDGEKLTSREVLQESQLEDTSWVFDVIEIEPQKLVDKKFITDINEAKDIANQIQQELNQKQNKVAKKFELEVKQHTGTVAKRNIPGLNNLSLDDYIKIYSLNGKDKVLNEPLYVGGKYFAIQLVKKELTPNKDSQSAPQDRSKQILSKKKNEVLEQWIATMAARANVKVFLPEEE